MRRKEIAGDRRVPYLASRPATEVAFNAQNELTHLVIVATQKPVGQPILVRYRQRRDDKRRPQKSRPRGVLGVRLYPPEFASEVKARPRKRRYIGDRRPGNGRDRSIGEIGRQRGQAKNACSRGQ